MPSEPTPTMSSPADKLIVLNAGSQLSIKLDGDNYPAWRIQFMALLTDYDLLGYIDGTTPCPSKQLANDTTVVNPDFTNWVRQDQLILHGIVSSVAATVVTHLGTVKSSNQAWEILKTMYASRSRVRIIALKQRISNFKKGNQSIATYLQGIKAISDELSIIDHPLDETDLVIHTLNGLTAEYREISAALRSRESPVAFAELHEKLMDFETIHHQADPLAVDNVIATANAATRIKNYHHKNNNNRSPSSTLRNGENKVVCQFCDKAGHTAKVCYRIKGFPKRNGPKPTANFAQNQAATQHGNWVMDTGASHHIAQDLQQLTLTNSYLGADRVIVGDGTDLEITHTGNSVINTSVKPLHLKQVLCVPKIQSNLLSVSKLCQSNSCSVEFFANHFVVKDLTSGQPLLQGPLKQDLYHLSNAFCSSSPPQALHTSIHSTSTWHHKLGHPSFKIIKHLTDNHHLPKSFRPHMSVLPVTVQKATSFLFQIIISQAANLWNFCTLMFGAQLLLDQ